MRQQPTLQFVSVLMTPTPAQGSKPLRSCRSSSIAAFQSRPGVLLPLHRYCCHCRNIHRFVAGGNPADAAFQLKSLIRALHAAGIEVLLEVRPQRDCVCHGGVWRHACTAHTMCISPSPALLRLLVFRLLCLLLTSWATGHVHGAAPALAHHTTPYPWSSRAALLLCACARPSRRLSSA